ncbi:hypothetical protein ACF0H5_021624 [Mactra antiquata]
MRYFNSDVFLDSLKNGQIQMVKIFNGAKPWEKVVCSYVIATVLALLLSADVKSFFDTFVMVLSYNIWIAFILPKIWKRLTLTLLNNVITVAGMLFSADIVIFGVYRSLRKYLSSSEVIFELTEQRGYIFIMNCVRVIVVIYCLYLSYPAFIRKVRGRRTTKKAVK